MGDHVIETAFIDCCMLSSSAETTNLSFTFYVFYTEDHVKVTTQKLIAQCNISSPVKACERIVDEVS